MTFHFKYKTIAHPDGTVAKVPLIPITLLGKEVIFTSGVVDSGSDTCALSRSMAEKLGLPLTGEKEVARGIGGMVESVQSQSLISIQQGKQRSQFNVPINVIMKPSDFPVLLGQIGFFDKLIIKFNKRKNKFSLKRVGRLFLR